MKVRIYAALVVVFAILVVSLVEVTNRLKKEKAKTEVYKRDVDVLMSGIKTYKVRDSLNVASVSRLELTLSEYKKYRTFDMQLIESLNLNTKRLEQITTAHTKTIYDLRGEVRDSLVSRDLERPPDTLRCLSIENKWFNLSGCIDPENEFSGTFVSRDSLLYVEYIVPKRFLFFRWGVKERRQEILSKNPHTKILNAEFISIRR